MTAFHVWALSGKSNIQLGLPGHLLISMSLLATSLWMFPQLVLAQSSPTPQTPTLAFEIQSQNQIQNAIELPLVPATVASSGPLQPSKADILRAYFISKKSPLQDYVGVLLQQPNYRLVISIFHAESNMCRRQKGNNCSGIGGAKYHRFYPSFAESIIDTNNLIQKYRDGGLDTPEKMMRRWVGWNNYNWVRANNQIQVQLNALNI